MMKTKIKGKNIIINNERLTIIFIASVIFLLNILHIKDIAIFSILDDEYGYWANAAYLSGLNWSDTVSKIPYYSYGYSILLVPLFWIFNNTIPMYKAAVIMNSIMLSLSFLLCYDIAKRLMDNANKFIVAGLSFVISVYPTYLIYANIAWSECLLMFIFWLLTWCFLGLDEESGDYKFYLIGFLSAYIYIVHQRTLGILIASISVIIIMKILNRINRKQLIKVVLPFLLLMIIGYYLKSNIQSNLWLNGSEISINDYSGQIKKINQVFSINGFIKVLKTFIGQFYYLGAVSFLIFYIGLYKLIKDNIKMIINLKKKNAVSSIGTAESYTYMFLLIAALSTVTISSVFFINPIRTNEIIFGRYNEVILGPIVLIGFVNLQKNRTISNKQFYIFVIVFSILIVVTDFIIKASGIVNHQDVDILGMISTKLPYGIYLTGLFGIILFRLIFISFSKNNNKFIVGSLIVISCIFLIIAEVRINSLVKQNKDRINIFKVTQTIESSKEDLPIYFLLKDTDIPEPVEWNGRFIRDRSVSDCYQFILKDKNIKPINYEELCRIRDRILVLTTKNMISSECLNDYNLLDNDEGSYLFITK